MLHTVSDAVTVVFCLDNRKREIRFIIQQIVRPLALSAGSDIPADNDSPICEVILHLDLLEFVPASSLDGRGNELQFNVLFGHFMLFHQVAH